MDGKIVNKKNNIKENVNDIVAIIVCTILIIASIIVGTPLKENTKVLTYITVGIFAIYIICYKIFLKNKYKEIIKNINLLDISIFILCISPIIPIVFKTTANYNDSYNIAIRYVTAFLLYFQSRILLMQNNKYKNYFCIALIITGIVNAIVGIDNLTIKFLTTKFKETNLFNFVNAEQRMIGGFGYANSFAISLTIPLIICMGKYLKDGKLKNLYLVISFIFATCIILSYSRATILVIILSIIVYCILQKKAMQNIKLINSMAVLLLSALGYSKIFTKYYQTTKYLLLFGSLIIIMLLAVLIINIINKITSKRSTKEYIIFVITIVISLVIFVAIGLNLGKPLEIFTNENQNSEIIFDLKNMELEQHYNFEFDIEAKVKENYEIYEIAVREQNKYNTVIEYHTILIGEETKIKNISFDTLPETDSLSIAFRTRNYKLQEGLIIKELKINGKNYNLDYVYLPYKIVNRICSMDIKNVFEKGRIAFYKDALKLIKQNPFTGIGGNGWKYKYQDIKSYDYQTVQVHSFPISIFLEFGIIAIIAYIIILICIAKNTTKILKDEYEIFVALFAILLHSMIDFDLSFMNILLYTIVLISMNSKNKVGIYED